MLIEAANINNLRKIKVVKIDVLLRYDKKR